MGKKRLYASLTQLAGKIQGNEVQQFRHFHILRGPG